jgi:hypothetical protein
MITRERVRKKLRSARIETVLLVEIRPSNCTEWYSRRDADTPREASSRRQIRLTVCATCALTQRSRRISRRDAFDTHEFDP